MECVAFVFIGVACGRTAAVGRTPFPRIPASSAAETCGSAAAQRGRVLTALLLHTMDDGTQRRGSDAAGSTGCAVDKVWIEGQCSVWCCHGARVDGGHDAVVRRDSELTSHCFLICQQSMNIRLALRAGNRVHGVQDRR